MDWGKKVIFLKIAITRGIFVMARNGFQLESPNHALSDDIFHGLKYDDLYLTIS